MYSIEILASSIIELERLISDWFKENINVEVINISQKIIKTVDGKPLHSISLKYNEI